MEQAEVQIETESLFESAHGALVFAFNFSGQSYDRPMMNRLAAPAIGTGKGLVGLDGAAQAGMIRAEIQTLGRLAEAILIARIAPRSTPCHCRAACCSGHKANREWTEAIAYLADYARSMALAGTSANGIMRRACVVRHFEPKDRRMNIEEIAAMCDLSRNTAGAFAGKVGKMLKELESVAQAAIEDRLRECGMVGD